MKPATKWIAAVAGLLGANVLAQVLLIAHATHEGSQVIPDYYEHAVHDDDDRALGWTVAAHLDGAELAVDVRDRDGAAVTGAKVSAIGYQRAHGRDRVAIALEPAASAYRGVLHGRPGWHDFMVVVERGATHFEQHVAIEVP